MVFKNGRSFNSYYLNVFNTFIYEYARIIMTCCGYSVGSEWYDPPCSNFTQLIPAFDCAVLSGCQIHYCLSFIKSNFNMLKCVVFSEVVHCVRI